MIALRSPIVQSGIRAVTPFGVVAAVYLLFAGHNRPGGGFAAGLVLGALVAVRAVAGLGRPTAAVPFLAAGGTLAALVAIAPVVVGHELLDQVVVETTVPVLGTIKSGSALVFDLGITAIVVAVVMVVAEVVAADTANAASTGDAVTSDVAREADR